MLNRIYWIVLLLAVSYYFPYALFAVAFIIAEIYISKTGNKHIEPDIVWGDDWLDTFISMCESPAEEAFLKTMIKEFNLKPNGYVLISNGITLELQVKKQQYRFDFLMNGKQIIEIDGKAWHSSPEQQEKDRIRDQQSIEWGYSVLRIPAKTVLFSPQKTISLVNDCLDKTPVYAEPKDDKTEYIFSRSPISVLEDLSSASSSLADYIEKAAEKRRVEIEIRREKNRKEIEEMMAMFEDEKKNNKIKRSLAKTVNIHDAVNSFNAPDIKENSNDNSPK
ncbi:endonuclease domain-containing protein [Morganella morganii]